MCRLLPLAENKLIELVGPGAGKPPLSQVTSGSTNLKNIGTQRLGKTVWNYLVKLVTCIPYNRKILFLGTYLDSGTQKPEDTYRMF